MTEGKIVEIMARAIFEADKATMRQADPRREYEWTESRGAQFLAFARAAVCALKISGFAIVPIEPTEAMCDAGYESQKDCDSIYRAMIEAAQKERETA
jgi:hypothetical protein